VGDSNKSSPAQVEKFVIRLPNGLREQIKVLSEQNRRSMNSEIIMVMEKHIQQFSQEDIRYFRAEELLQEVRGDEKKGVPLTDQVL